MQYVKVPEVNKVFDQSVIDALEAFDTDTITPVKVGDKVLKLSDLKKAVAVDDNFDTAIANLTAKKAEVEAEAQAAIDAKTAEQKAYDEFVAGATPVEPVV